MRHGIFNLLFHGNQAKEEEGGAGLGPYSYTELICGWDAPPSSPTEQRKRKRQMDLVCLSCMVLLIHPHSAPAMESAAYRHSMQVQMCANTMGSVRTST